MITKKQILKQATEVFGSAEVAKEWMRTPNLVLSEKTPLECADTEDGLQEVLNLLGRLEHGVYS